MATPTWPTVDHARGEPTSAEIRSANSSARARIALPSRPTICARCAGSRVGQGPVSKAPRAAATAASTSAIEALGTRPIGSSVAGENTSITRDEAGGTQPPMKRFSWVYKEVSFPLMIRSGGRATTGPAREGRRPGSRPTV